MQDCGSVPTFPASSEAYIVLVNHIKQSWSFWHVTFNVFMEEFKWFEELRVIGQTITHCSLEPWASEKRYISFFCCFVSPLVLKVKSFVKVLDLRLSPSPLVAWCTEQLGATCVQPKQELKLPLNALKLKQRSISPFCFRSSTLSQNTLIDGYRGGVAFANKRGVLNTLSVVYCVLFYVEEC